MRCSLAIVLRFARCFFVLFISLITCLAHVEVLEAVEVLRFCAHTRHVIRVVTCKTGSIRPYSSLLFKLLRRALVSGRELFFALYHEYMPISRSEQAPGSEFHPWDKSEKVDCDFLGPSWCNKKVNPET